MKESTARKIMEIMEDAGHEARLRENYSGRGMYGSTTFAVVGDRSQITKAITYAAYCLGLEEGRLDEAFANGAEGDQGDKLIEERDAANKAANEFIADTDRLRWDSMGRDSEVVY